MNNLRQFLDRQFESFPINIFGREDAPEVPGKATQKAPVLPVIAVQHESESSVISISSEPSLPDSDSFEEIVQPPPPMRPVAPV